MDSDARTAQLIHQRYQDTSLVIFHQAQNKLKREHACKTVGSSDMAECEGDVSSKHRFSNLFGRRSHSKATQSAICNLL